MTGPKTNEGATSVDESTGTRSTAKYVRSSAYKARVVLDLIRGLDVKAAADVLRFTERGISTDIAKVLASAIANAEHNDGQEAEELYVRACFADEGPTLKRFRPRARGRASRIRKRTCHITVVVDRMSDDKLAIKQARESAKVASGRGARVAGSSAAARRARVERSRAAAGGATDTHDHDHDHDHEGDDHESHGFADLGTGAEGSASDEAQAARGESAADDEPAIQFGPGSSAPTQDGSAPEGFSIKGNADSMLYHLPDGRWYDATIAEVWFDTEEAAQAAGFTKAGTRAKDSDDAADAEEGA